MSNHDEQSFNDFVAGQLAGLHRGLVAENERLSRSREGHLLAENQQLRAEIAILRSQVLQDGRAKALTGVQAANSPGGLGITDPGGSVSLKKPSQGSLTEHQAILPTTGRENIVEKPDQFPLLPELKVVHSAGSRELTEDYWLDHAINPNFDQGFFDSGQQDLHGGEGKDLHEHHEHCVIDPTSLGKLIWDILGIPILAWDLITIPLQVFNLGESAVMNFAGWCTLIYWTGDFPVTCVTGFFDDEGDLVMQPWLIFRRYLKSFFFLDVLILAGDWGAIFIGLLGSSAPPAMQNLAILRIFRITRFVRLLRLRKLKEIFNSLQDNIESEGILVTVNLMKSIMTILGMNHYVCCVWFWIGTSPPPDFPSWVSAHSFPQYGGSGDSFLDAPWEYQYITALHWAICQFTPGGMHIQPQNVGERIYSITCLLFGMVVFSSFLANVTQARMQMSKMVSKLDKDLWQLRKYCHKNHISRGLVIRMKRYVDLVITKHFTVLTSKDVVLIPALSKHLREELQTELLSQKLRVHPFLEYVARKNKAVNHAICNTVIDRHMFARGDVLFSTSQNAKCMYFITNGAVEYIAHSKNHVGAHGGNDIVSSPSWICEATLWTKWTTQGQLQGDIETQALSVDAAKFRAALLSTGLIMAFVRRYALAFLGAMNRYSLEKGHPPSDLQECFLQEIDFQALEGDGHAKL
jgi:hypothetical protein